MTEELTPDQLITRIATVLATAKTNDLQRIVASLLVEAVDQVQKSPNTWQHEEVSLTARDLAEEALAVGLEPQDVIFATARASSTMVVELCKIIGIDPSVLARSYEEETRART